MNTLVELKIDNRNEIINTLIELGYKQSVNNPYLYTNNKYNITLLNFSKIASAFIRQHKIGNYNYVLYKPLEYMEVLKKELRINKIKRLMK